MKSPLKAAFLLISFALNLAAAETPLVEAARRGDIAQVRALLGRKIDANTLSVDGGTALHIAVQREDVPMVDLLLRSGANAKTVNRYGVAPLYVAAINSNGPIVEKLLIAGADPNTTMPDGETVLMTAARTGKVEALKVLIARGANIRALEPSKGQSALMWAAAENNAAAAKLLVEAGANLHERSRGGYVYAVAVCRPGRTYRNIQSASGAWRQNRRRTSRWDQRLVLATINAHYELAGSLLDKGADPTAAAQGWTALHQVAWSRRHNAGSISPDR